MKQKIMLKPLIVSIAIPLISGFISSILGGDMRETYNKLIQPEFAPPGWLFGVVWPILYVLMGIAFYLVWRAPQSDTKTQAIVFYFVQLLLNILWTPLFFRFGLLKIAFWELCTLLVITVVMTAFFALTDKRTLPILAPYLIWLVFAGILNKAIVILNGNFI